MVKQITQLRRIESLFTGC